MGEPAGISSEITLKIWKNYRKKIDPFIYFGDPEHLLNTSKISVGLMFLVSLFS